MSKIRIIKDKEKFNIIKNLPHNCIYNRFDLVFFNDFNLLEVIQGEKKFYIPYHIEKIFYCHLASFMLGMEDDTFNDVIAFMKKKYPLLTTIEIWHSLNPYKGLRQTNNCILYLPKTMEEYNKNFTSKTLYNRRYALSKLMKNFKIEFKHFERKDFTKELLETFLKFKNEGKISCGDQVYYSEDYTRLLGSVYYLTDIWALYINDAIAAVILYSCTNGTDYWCENMAYNNEYRQYGIGNVLYYYSIEQIINRKGKLIILGGGQHDYKLNSKAQNIKTYTGYIDLCKSKLWKYALKILLGIFSVKTVTDRWRNEQRTITTVLGVRFKKKRKIQL